MLVLLANPKSVFKISPSASLLESSPQPPQAGCPLHLGPSSEKNCVLLVSALVVPGTAYKEILKNHPLEGEIQEITEDLTTLKSFRGAGVSHSSSAKPPSSSAHTGPSAGSCTHHVLHGWLAEQQGGQRWPGSREGQTVHEEHARGSLPAEPHSIPGYYSRPAHPTFRANDPSATGLCFIQVSLLF